MTQTNYSSEYETDLKFLRNFDSLTTDILCKARRINIFLFDIDMGKEIDYSIDGDMYVYIRNEEPKHCVLIVNRRKKKCLREPIVHDLCWGTRNAMLLYRKGSTMYNICFKTYEDFSYVAGIVISVLQTLTESSPRLSSSQPAEQQQQQCLKEEKPALVEEETPTNIQTPNEPISTKENVQNIDDKQIPVSPQMKKEDIDRLITALAIEDQSKPKPILIAPLSVGDYTVFEYCPFPANYLEEMTSKLTLKEQSIDETSKEDKKMEDPIHSGGEASGPLNVNQLSEALVFKLKNDPEFARKIYDEYLRHFKK